MKSFSTILVTLFAALPLVAMASSLEHDSHGCNPSTGYTWCAVLNKCVRTWETPCVAPPKPGNCLASAGYTWCAVLNKCVRTWVTPCVAPPKPVNHGCLASAGYTWCPVLNKCVRTWETPCVAKPDVCILGIGLNWKCYPKGYGDGLPPCCNRYGNNHAGNCKNGNYNTAQIQCTAPGLCSPKMGNGCYKSSGMPKCCKGNGGSGCTYKSNVECDVSNGNILEDAFNDYLTDMNQYDEVNIDDGEEDEDAIIETYTEGNLRG